MGRGQAKFARFLESKPTYLHDLLRGKYSGTFFLIVFILSAISCSEFFE